MTYQASKEILATSNPIIIADREELSKAIAVVTNVVERKNRVPALANVLIKGNGQDLSLTTTDLDMEITVNMAGAADSRFNSTIPAHTLANFVKKAPASDFVSFTQSMDDDQEKVAVDFESVRYDLDAIPSDEFETLPNSELALTTFEIAGDWLNETIATLLTSISTEETRYYLNGIYMELSEGKLIFVSTDGHRLLKRSITAPEGLETMPGAIIPTKACKLFSKLTRGKNTPGMVKLSVSESRTILEYDNTRIETKTIDGAFPDYTRVIPLYNEFTAKLDATELSKAVEAVSVVSNTKGRAVKFGFDSEVKSVTVDCHNPEIGNGHATIECDYQGDALEAGYNSKYIMEMAKALCPNGGELTFKIESSGAPALITGSLEGLIGVQMPMRV